MLENLLLALLINLETKLILSCEFSPKSRTSAKKILIINRIRNSYNFLPESGMIKKFFIVLLSFFFIHSLSLFLSRSLRETKTVWMKFLEKKLYRLQMQIPYFEVEKKTVKLKHKKK